jgi:hypothetical protein
MEPSSTTPASTYDRDLDPPRPRLSWAHRPPPIPQQYQRLVANPFLGLFGLIAWFSTMRYALLARSLPLVWLMTVGLAGVVLLLQYHCLDCGATGLLFHWKSHACERVRERQQAGLVRTIRGPNPVYQTFLWAFVLMVAAMLALPMLWNDVP